VLHASSLWSCYFPFVRLSVVSSFNLSFCYSISLAGLVPYFLLRFDCALSTVHSLITRSYPPHFPIRWQSFFFCISAACFCLIAQLFHFPVCALARPSSRFCHKPWPTAMSPRFNLALLSFAYPISLAGLVPYFPLRFNCALSIVHVPFFLAH
jgi:hypothetical protein